MRTAPEGVAEYQPGKCYAPGCGRPIASRMLMCRFHWRCVPRQQQQAIYAALRDHGALSAAWYAAAHAARESLGKRGKAS